MNYHIIPQDKFFESYIEDIYRIHQEDHNIIWVRGEKGESPFFHTNRPVEYLGYDAQVFFEHLKTIKPNEKLFVAWYDVFIGNIILQSGIKADLYVYIMGGDFYSQPEWWHTKWLLDPITKRRIIKERLLPTIFPIRKPWRWYRLFVFIKQQKQQYSEKLETIKRINYLILPEHAIEEVSLIHRLYPGCKAEHRVGSFNQNFDLSRVFSPKKNPQDEKAIKLLLGNSSDPSGNQMDAIHYLKKQGNISFVVYCLLSYGDRNACKWICEYGKLCLGNRFHPISKFMKKDQYIRFLNEMDVVVMFHNRQQAVGAIVLALSLGKPVFLKEQSPVFKHLSSLGIKSIYKVANMHAINFRDAIYSAQENRDDTIERLSLEYSEVVRLKHLNELLT